MFKASMDIATDRVFDENGDNISNSSNWPTKLFYFNYNFYTSVDAIRKLVLNTCLKISQTIRIQKPLPNTASNVSKRLKTMHVTITIGLSTRMITTPRKWA